MKILTILLIAAITLIPLSAKSQTAPPQQEQKSRIVGGVVLAVLVIGTGMIVIAGLKKMCKKIPPPRGTNAPPEDISINFPTIQSPTNIESSMVSLERFDGSIWQEAYTVTFDDQSNATVTKNGEVIMTNIPCYTVPSTNGEYLVYYDLRQVWIEEKPFAFFRLMSQ